MPYYTSINDRSVATLQGVTYNFKSMQPQMVVEGEDTVIAAGIMLSEDFEATLKGKVVAAPIVVNHEPIVEDLETDDPEDIVAEMAAVAVAERELEAARAAAEAEEEAEKSPVFDQVVFEAAVHGILDSGDVALLTPKGFPKASAIKDLTGFDVTPIKVVQFCKSLKE